MTAFKWAYDDADGALDVWKVDGPEASARPQHGEVLNTEQYANFYQGRLVIGRKGFESFVIYEDRPFVGRTDEGAQRATDAIDEWLSDL